MRGENKHRMKEEQKVIVIYDKSESMYDDKLLIKQIE